MVSTARDPLIQLDNVEFDYGGGLLFQGFSEAIYHGERIALLGRSGAGKSTLLRLLGGLLQPTSGRIHWPDNDEAHSSSLVGFLFQDHALLPWLTALENIRLALILARAPKRFRLQQDQLIEDTARQLSISSVLSSYPHQLSGGMRQRVALARALVTNPQLLCLDEPFSALDPVLRGEAREVVETAIETSGAATIIVTHDIGDAMAVAERIWLLRSEGPLTHITTVTRGDPRWTYDGLLACYR